MATTWIPMTRMEPKSWLLGNGEIVKEPPLEMTSSGRKVRVAGTKDSAYQKELDTLLQRSVNEIAALKSTHIWLNLSRPVEEMVSNKAGYLPAATKAKLHLVHAPSERHASTICWWRFKDPNTPFEALLTVMARTAPVGSQPVRQNIRVTLTVPTRDYYGDGAPDATLVSDTQFSSMLDQLYPYDSQLKYKWLEFMQNNPPNWTTELLGFEEFSTPRAGVTRLLDLVRAFDDFDMIQVPHFGNPDEPSWCDLELYETNVNAEFISDLTEYLDGAPTIEQAVEHYQQMLETLRSVGIVVAAKEPNDFMAALLAGEKETLNMKIHNLAEQDMLVDHDHTLSVHLPSGAFIVECSHRGVSKDEIVESWEEAKTIAALTGEEPELLAYARAYAQDHGNRRTKRIIAERK